jgi:hypothetical protein
MSFVVDGGQNQGNPSFRFHVSVLEKIVIRTVIKKKEVQFKSSKCASHAILLFLLHKKTTESTAKQANKGIQMMESPRSIRGIESYCPARTDGPLGFSLVPLLDLFASILSACLSLTANRNRKWGRAESDADIACTLSPCINPSHPTMQKKRNAQ